MSLEDKSGNYRFLKSHLGVPVGVGLSREEQILKAQTEGVNELRGLRDDFRYGHLARRDSPITPVTPSVSIEVNPEVHLDYGAMADALSPQLDSLLDSQRELAQMTARSGYTGELVLHEAQVHTDVLNSLDAHARDAYDQRNRALHVMSQSLATHERTNELLHGSNVLLGDISGQIGSLEQSLLQSLGSVGRSIDVLTNQLVTSTCQILDTLGEFQAVFVWAHRQQLRVLHSIDYALAHPLEMRTRELWQRGEHARIAGLPDDAAVYFQQCLSSDPAFSYTYYSLACLALDKGDVSKARAHLKHGLAYARGNTVLESRFYLLKGMIAYHRQSFEATEKHLLAAHAADPRNLDVWFGLGLLYARVGSLKKAFYYVSNLMYAARAKQPLYVYRVLATPEFFPLYDRIAQFMSSR